MRVVDYLRAGHVLAYSRTELHRQIDGETALRRPGQEFIPKSQYVALRLSAAFAVLIVILLSIGQLGLRRMTESLLLANADVTTSVLKKLRSSGLTLAIDDFGTGYSSFSYLRQFQVSKLKIDRSFLRDVARKPDDAAIATAIISMAKSLNLRVIAEGVEEEEQMSFVRSHGCDEIQGYYFSKPLTADKVSARLRNTTTASAQAAGQY